MLRRTGAIALGTVLGAALLPGSAGAAIKTVYAGTPPSAGKIAAKLLPKGFVKTYNPDVNDFFLHRVTVHVGDRVRFKLSGFHTVDLPGKSGRPIPLITTGATVSGVNDAAGSPFWFSGKLPAPGFNPALTAPIGKTTYTGKARIDTGLPLGPAKPLTVKFTKPGTYKYFCDVHPGMIGVVVVKKKHAKVPTTKQDGAALTAQLTGDLKAAKQLAKSKIAANKVSLGVAGPGGLELFAMFPSSLTVKAGTTVTFSMSQRSYEVHTATFGPANYTVGLSNAASPPALFADPKVTAQAIYPSDPVQPIALGTSTHGNGFANTGALDSDPLSKQIPASSQIKFTTAGTYHYLCLIHPQMQGTVVVQ